jgi:hypothetical protein
MSESILEYLSAGENQRLTRSMKKQFIGHELIEFQKEILKASICVQDFYFLDCGDIDTGDFLEYKIEYFQTID